MDFIHQPLIQLYKRRLGLAQTAPNDLLFHRGVLDFKSLASTLITKQATSVLKRVNSCKTVGILAEIRIKQGAIKAGILKNMRSTQFSSEFVKLWRGNLTCNVIDKCKAMNLRFEVRSHQEERVKESWLLTDLLEEKLVKQSVKARIDLEIVSLNQILDPTGGELMT